MLSGASSSGRRSLQALHRLACSGLDATTSSSVSSGLFRCDVAGAEQPRHIHGSAAGAAALSSSWAQPRRQLLGQQAVLGHTDCYAAGRVILSAPQLSPQTAASVPLGAAAAAGSARGAKAQAAQQRGGSKQQQQHQQQQSRQRRATASEYPVENQKGVISVLSTKNNTIVTLADEGGNVKAW